MSQPIFQEWLDEAYKLAARKIFAAPKQVKSDCLHKNCANCNGTGISIYGGLCVHSISCPCNNCKVS